MAPLCVVLGLITALLFLRVFVCGFVNLDDPQYVTTNEHVQRGLNWQGVAWAFTTLDAANWQPLTWLSLELDATLFGLSPAGFHGVNLALHIANTVLLFLTLRYMTTATWPSAGAALAFAIHPLHVESVAWVAERKDVLSTLFWILAMMAYARYARRPSLAKYVLVCLLLACGLGAKPMLVTLPCVFLLLDYWPLQRTGARRLVSEKVPLFAISLASGVLTIAAQSAGNAVATSEGLPLGLRLMNAADAYLAYLGRALWPLDLAVVYPHPMRKQAVLVAAVGVAILAAVTALVARKRQAQPYLLVGWLWYLVTLLPVIGLVQVGNQAIADRYTYVPLVGIFIGVAWALHELVASGRISKGIVTALGGTAFVSFGLCTWNQVGYWRDSVTLWRHSIDVTGPNWQACQGLGDALLEQGQLDEAIPVLRDVVKLAPDFAPGHASLGTAFMLRGDLSGGAAELRRALELDPSNIHAHQNLAVLLANQGDLDGAVAHLHAALEIQPGLRNSQLLLAEILKKQGK